MVCLRKVPHMDLKTRNYALMDDFYVVELIDTNVVLVVKWLITIERHWKDYNSMEMEWVTPKAKRVWLKGITTRASKFVKTKNMEVIFHGEDHSLGHGMHGIPIKWIRRRSIVFGRHPGLVG